MTLLTQTPNNLIHPMAGSPTDITRRTYGWSNLKPSEALTIAQIADQYGLPYSKNLSVPSGVQLMFENTHGISPELLFKQTVNGMLSRKLSCHQWMDPFFEMEDVCGSKMHPHRVATMLYVCWQIGKIGFPYLPNPAETSPSTYASMVKRLVYDLSFSGKPNPEILISNNLNGQDLSFYQSLPDEFTVYRGKHGIEAPLAASGICWTTSLDVAKWYAERFQLEGERYLVLSAKVRKSDVLLALAGEFEIVVQPSDWDVLISTTERMREVSKPKYFSWDEMQQPEH